MKVSVDINHPSDVHLFKNFIWLMLNNGNDVVVTASDKDVTLKLLENYGLKYTFLGSYGKSLSSKLKNIVVLDYNMYRAVKRFNPDVFIGLASIRAAHVSKLLGKKSIILDDTDHSKIHIYLYKSFADIILTPECFYYDLGGKQIRYKGYHELAYLHPNYFKPNPSFLSDLGLSEGDPFIIVRFVAWDAHHDIGQYGIKNKIEYIKGISNFGRVFIVSEEKLNKELEEFRLNIKPEKLHDLLYYAKLYVGEGATTASEAAVLGTHAVYINTLKLSYMEEQEKKFGLVYSYTDPQNLYQKSIEKIGELMSNPNLWIEGKKKREKLLSEKIDVTSYMIRVTEFLYHGKDIRSSDELGI